MLGLEWMEDGGWLLWWGEEAEIEQLYVVAGTTRRPRSSSHPARDVLLLLRCAQQLSARPRPATNAVFHQRFLVGIRLIAVSFVRR